MTPEPRLEDRLRASLHRPETSPWPDEHGAFDRFLRRRARRGRALAARGALALVVAVALAAGIPRLLPRPVVPATPPVTGRPMQLPSGGFEITVPAGWTDLNRSRRIFTPGRETGSGVGLRPMRRTTGTLGTMVTVYTAILSPAQYPGTEPGGRDPAPSVSADRTTIRLDDTTPLGRGRRPDGRPYVWQTKLGALEVAQYAIAWPYHCAPDQACPPAARWRALIVHGLTEEGPATRGRVLAVVRRIVDTVRPVTNALPGGAPGVIDLAVPPVKGRWLLGSGGRGRGAWRAYVRQGGEDVFELEFPSRMTRPGVGVHAEDIEPTIYLLNGQVVVLRDCLSWLSPQVGLVSGAVPEQVTSVRIELAGRPALTARAFGHDRPARWAAYVSEPLPRGTRVTRVVALDANGRVVAESERDEGITHPVCHVFR
jgi:hypothetical protein